MECGKGRAEGRGLGAGPARSRGRSEWADREEGARERLERGGACRGSGEVDGSGGEWGGRGEEMREEGLGWVIRGRGRAWSEPGKRERRKGRGKRDSGKEGKDTRAEKRKWEGNRRD